MIRNFLTVAIRNFLRQRLYSFINVFGLTSGLTCALFIYLWVHDEVSKDKFHEESEKIFRIVSNLQLNDGEILSWSITPGPLAEDIRDNIPEADLVVRTQDAGGQLFQYGDKRFTESGFYADPDFFNLFSFEILQGIPNKDTADISSISISQRLASKLFGNEDAIGKTVKVNNQYDYTIAAVFKDTDSRSSLQFEFIFPFEIYKKNRGGGFNWGNFDHPLYVKLHDEDQSGAAIAKINARRAEANPDGDNIEFYIQPFTEYYLNADYQNGRPSGGRIKYVRIFTVVAVFILVIACINFMNMATAKAANRAKEVGVRKVVGAGRKGLIAQFIAESTMISFISMLLALALAYLMLPLFNALVNKEILLDLSDIRMVGIIILITVITGIVAGSYPAFFLSSYQPARVLKSTNAQEMGGASLRKILVVFQFGLTVILIASSLVVYNQIQFIMNKDVGYDRESVLTFPLQGNLGDTYDAFKNELQQVSGVRYVSRADNSLVQVNNQNGSVEWPGKPDESAIFFRTVTVDYDFPETMGLELLEGRFFKQEFNDTSTFLLTERAVEVMGLQNPVGARIVQWGQPGEVIGVVSDFHSRSMHEAIDPIVLMFQPKWAWRVFVRFDAGQAGEAIRQIEEVHKKYVPEYPFNYAFLDDQFEKLYNNEQVIGSLALGFTIMAIIISALGLLGLAAYTAERKRKEISIRKTMGASVSGIVSKMSTDFIQLSLIAAILGCPIAYYLMGKFLQSYAYHAPLKWDLFIITALIVLFLSLATVIFQVTRAAIANPVDALRNE